MKMVKKIVKFTEDMCYRLEVKRLLAGEKLREVREDNRGIAIIEVILILVVVLGVIVVFRKNIQDMIKDIFTKIKGNKDTIVESFE